VVLIAAARIAMPTTTLMPTATTGTGIQPK
jgi:hypothetical protein